MFVSKKAIISIVYGVSLLCRRGDTSKVWPDPKFHTPCIVINIDIYPFTGTSKLSGGQKFASHPPFCKHKSNTM